MKQPSASSWKPSSFSLFSFLSSPFSFCNFCNSYILCNTLGSSLASFQFDLFFSLPLVPLWKFVYRCPVKGLCCRIGNLASLLKWASLRGAWGSVKSAMSENMGNVKGWLLSALQIQIVFGPPHTSVALQLMKIHYWSSHMCIVTIFFLRAAVVDSPNYEWLPELAAGCVNRSCVRTLLLVFGQMGTVSEEFGPYLPWALLECGLFFVTTTGKIRLNLRP